MHAAKSDRDRLNTIGLFPHCFSQYKYKIVCIANKRNEMKRTKAATTAAAAVAKTDDWNRPHAHTTVHFVMVHADIHSLSLSLYLSLPYLNIHQALSLFADTLREPSRVKCVVLWASAWMSARTHGGRLCTHNFHPEKQSILQSKQVLRVPWKIFL